MTIKSELITTDSNQKPVLAGLSSTGTIQHVGMRTVAGYEDDVGAILVCITGSNIGLSGSTATLPISGLVGLTGSTATIPISGLVGLTGSTTNLPISGLVGLSGAQQVGLTGSTVNLPISGLVGLTGSTAILPVSGLVGFSGSQQVGITGSTVNIPITGQISYTPALSDAFGRLRVSEPYTLFDAHFSTTKLSTIFEEKISGAAVGTLVPHEASVNMIVLGSGDKIVRQTKEYFVYQPGKSRFIKLTSVPMTGATVDGVVSRIGVFDDHVDKLAGSGGNGFYFEVSGSQLAIVKRTYTSGSQMEVRIPQASWNQDTLNGTGVSRITLDPTKAQIFIMDMEWLGVGRVRCGFDVSGALRLAHIFDHANIVDRPYTTSATLPVRYEIFSTSGSNQACLKQICCSIESEGGFDPQGRVYSADRGIVAQVVNDDYLVPIISIRLIPSGGYIRSTVNPLSSQIMTSTTASMYWAIYKNATISGAVWQNVGNDSHVQFDISGSGVVTTTAQKIFAGYFSNDTNQSFKDFEGIDHICASISGAPETLTLVAQNIANQNDNVYGSLTWQEWN